MPHGVSHKAPSSSTEKNLQKYLAHIYRKEILFTKGFDLTRGKHFCTISLDFSISAAHSSG